MSNLVNRNSSLWKECYKQLACSAGEDMMMQRAGYRCMVGVSHTQQSIEDSSDRMYLQRKSCSSK